MIISSKGRYALRVMIDLAEHDTGKYISLKTIAERQDISRKYLEQIMSNLSKHNLVESSYGKDGGYRIKPKAHDCRIGDILRATEGNLSPVACVGQADKKCEKTDLCYTFPFWQGLAEQIDAYVDSYTLEDMLSDIKSNKETCCQN